MNKTFCVYCRWCRFGWQTFFAFRFWVKGEARTFLISTHCMPMRRERKGKKYLITIAIVQKSVLFEVQIYWAQSRRQRCVSFWWNIWDPSNKKRQRRQQNTVPNRSSKSRSYAFASLWRCAVSETADAKLLFTIFYQVTHNTKAIWKNEWTARELLLLLLVYLVEWKQQILFIIEWVRAGYVEHIFVVCRERRTCAVVMTSAGLSREKKTINRTTKISSYMRWHDHMCSTDNISLYLTRCVYRASKCCMCLYSPAGDRTAIPAD